MSNSVAHQHFYAGALEDETLPPTGQKKYQHPSTAHVGQRLAMTAHRSRNQCHYSIYVLLFVFDCLYDVSGDLLGFGFAAHFLLLLDESC